MPISNETAFQILREYIQLAADQHYRLHSPDASVSFETCKRGPCVKVRRLAEKVAQEQKQSERGLK